MNKPSVWKSWSTQLEIKFIDGLGKQKHSCNLNSRLQLLERYVAALQVRKNWNGIDSARISGYAQDSLRSEKAKCAWQLMGFIKN